MTAKMGRSCGTARTWRRPARSPHVGRGRRHCGERRECTSSGRPAAATAAGADANTNTAQPPLLLVREEPRPPTPQQQQPAPPYYSALVPWDVQCGGSSAQQRTAPATSCYGPPDAAAPLPLPLPQRDLTAWMASDYCPSGPEQLPPLPIAGQACSAAVGANHGPPAVQPPPPPTLLQLSELTSTASRHSNSGQALRTSGSGSGYMPGDTSAEPTAAQAASPTTTLLLPPPPLPCPGPLPLLYSAHNALLGLPNGGVGMRRLSAFSASGTTAGGGSSAASLMLLPAASAAATDARLQWQQHGGVCTNTISTDSSFGLPHHHHRASTPRCCHTSASAATTPSVCTAAAAATAVADPDSGCSIFDSPPLAEMLSAALVEPPAADAHAAAGAAAFAAAAAPAEVRDLYDAWRANPEEHEPEPPTSSGDAGGIIQGGRRPPASRHFLQPGAFNLGPADHSHPHLPSAAAAGAAVAAPPVIAFAAHAHGDHDIAPQAWQDLQQQQQPVRRDVIAAAAAMAAAAELRRRSLAATRTSASTMPSWVRGSLTTLACHPHQEKRGQEQGQGQEHEEGLLLPPPLAHTASDASSVVCAAGSGGAWDTGVAAATATGRLGKSAVAADLLAGREASAHADASSVPVSPALVAAAPASAVTATMV
ncbi:hypothetical protein HYH02_005630 [Chlamydomonas schloesseri]|uniref:Uncharacterized protein n=1 Tax=Chlamydomonas schloesseri TaxID=2026947 RepID=A0A835WL84_9CHLO|nr:hypothetical protein HYH02_005630 [Chlamydomonas schloesseri]|eukprot:KAG2449486.1 hypothetical protein HYH02_005630 [Chlamydomonas schloesseri]